jgi:hypothetical protein
LCEFHNVRMSQTAEGKSFPIQPTFFNL